MRTTSPKLDISHLTSNEQAELRCRTALELKDRNEYDASREAMFPIWNGSIGSRPNTKGLSDAVAAEVLLTTGILTGWLGSRSEIKKADDYARDLITESITLYEALHDSRKVAEARTELAWCYWRSNHHGLRIARSVVSQLIRLTSRRGCRLGCGIRCQMKH